MPVREGVIQKVVSKEMPEDKYGNTFRRAFALQGEDGFFSVSPSKTPDLSVKDGGNWVKLKEGDSVEFTFTQNGDFKNVKVSAITLVGKGSTAPAQTATQAVSKPSNKDAGIKVGHALNCACALFSGQGDKVDDATLKEVATRILVLSETLNKEFDSIMDGATIKQTESKPAKTKPVQKKAEVQQSVAEMEEDYPFDDEDVPF